MKIQIVSVGTRSPAWVQAGVAEYTKRMPRDLPVELIEVPAGKHHSDAKKFIALESAGLLAKVKSSDWVVALDEAGQSLSSVALAARIDDWRQGGQDVTFFIGGSDGLGDTVRARADETISLSKLTLPHYMVRVVLAEALYRAWSIGYGHPYHRE